MPARFYRALLAVSPVPKGHLDPEEETTVVQGFSPALPSCVSAFLCSPPPDLCTRWARFYVMKAVPGSEYQGPLQLEDGETESGEEWSLAHGHPGAAEQGRLLFSQLP